MAINKIETGKKRLVLTNHMCHYIVRHSCTNHSNLPNRLFLKCSNSCKHGAKLRIQGLKQMNKQKKTDRGNLFHIPASN